MNGFEMGLIGMVFLIEKEIKFVLVQRFVISTLVIDIAYKTIISIDKVLSQTYIYIYIYIFIYIFIFADCVSG